MANPNPVKKFKKGSIEASLAGKKSSNALPPELKEARLLNARMVEETLYRHMSSPLEVLQEKLKDPTTPAMELVIIKILTEAIKTGDERRLEFLLSRTIGKVKEKIDLEAKVGLFTLHDLVMKTIEEENGNK